MSWKIAAFYRFTRLGDLEKLREHLRQVCAAGALTGTILIAAEGINGTVAGAAGSIDALLDELDRLVGIRQGEVKFSTSDDQPFSRMKVRIRPEIITLRAPEADPSVKAGTYVEPRDWNALVDDPDVLILDTRNAYETRLGGFRGARDPKIDRFTQLKDFVEAELDPGRHRKVAMFCTGGIRCEKASAFMLAKGFETVFHLKGGILKYLEEVPAEESRWEGDCYVFDERVAVGHGLAQGDWSLCHGCGRPLAPCDLDHPAFEAGVSCHQCAGTLDPARATGLRMRQRQMTGGAKGDRA